MKLKLVTLLIFFGTYGYSQKNEDSIFKHGVSLQIGLEDFADGNKLIEPSIGLKYFGEVKINKSNFVTIGTGINYSTIEIFDPHQVINEIGDSIYNYSISIGESIIKYEYFSFDIEAKYQFFPFKKIPLLLTLGIESQFLLQKKGNENLYLQGYFSTDFILDSSDVFDSEILTEEQLTLVNVLNNLNIGFLGFRNERFKIENTFKFGFWNVKESKLFHPYARGAIFINFSYYL